MMLHLLLQVFILQHLSKFAHGQTPPCSPAVQVHRNKVYQSLLGESLRIKCPVRFCSNSQPNISWHKHVEGKPFPVNMSHRVKTEWNIKEYLVGESSLILNPVQLNDSGIYLCRVVADTSHKIMVNVSDQVKSHNASNGTCTVESQAPSNIWNYVYVSVGILFFVIIVIIMTVLSQKYCKGSTGKETENEISMIPVVQRNRRGSSHVPTAQLSVRKKTRSSKPATSNEVITSQIEEERCVEYAALNHPHDAAPRQPRPEQESTEYTAIMVYKDRCDRSPGSQQPGPSD